MEQKQRLDYLVEKFKANIISNDEGICDPHLKSNRSTFAVNTSSSPTLT